MKVLQGRTWENCLFAIAHLDPMAGGVWKWAVTGWKSKAPMHCSALWWGAQETTEEGNRSSIGAGGMSLNGEIECGRLPQPS